MEVITIILTIVIIAIIGFYIFVEHRQLKNKNYILDLILNKYNNKIYSLQEYVDKNKIETNLTKKKIIFNQREDFKEEEIYKNLKLLDIIEDNYELVNAVLSEKKAENLEKNKTRINLLKDLDVVSDLRLCKFDTNNTIQAQILNVFKESLKFNKIQHQFAPFFSNSTAYSIDKKILFMPLEKGVMLINIENVFATTFIEWKDVTFKMELVDESYVPYDNSVMLDEITHKKEEVKEGEDPEFAKELMLQKTYSLHVTAGEVNLDVTHFEILNEKNALLMNVLEIVNNFEQYKDKNLGQALVAIGNKNKKEENIKKNNTKSKKKK